MDEIKLKEIVRKHRNRTVNFFILMSFIFLSINYYYQNSEALQIMAYSSALVVTALVVVLNFVEKVITEINSNLKHKDIES